MRKAKPSLAIAILCLLGTAADTARAQPSSSAFPPAVQFAKKSFPSDADDEKLPRVAPPVALKVLAPNGSNVFSLAYVLQALTYQLALTADASLAEQIVDRGDAMLAERNAMTDEGRPFGWLDSSADVDRPYAWGGFTGHNFAPLMHFAQIVLNNPSLAQKTYKGQTFRSRAIDYIDEFKVALEAHSRTDLVQGRGFAYFKLPNDLPVSNPRAPGSPYPVNMNAAMFSSILHLSCAEERLGANADALRHRKLVSEFVSFLKSNVLVSTKLNGMNSLIWNYSSYIPRVEDVGHANNVIRFIIEAHESGYPIDRNIIDSLVGTADFLMQPDGSINSDLIDGSNYRAPLSHSIYYFILLGKYSDSIKTKISFIRKNSNIFTYQGAAQYTLTEKRALDVACGMRNL